MSLSIRKTTNFVICANNPPYYWLEDSSNNIYNIGGNGDISGVGNIQANSFNTQSLNVGSTLNKNGIKFAAGLAVTDLSGGYSSYAVTYDGINWIKVTNSLGSNVKGIYYSPQQRIWGAAGSSGTFYTSYSTNGLN